MIIWKSILYPHFGPIISLDLPKQCDVLIAREQGAYPTIWYAVPDKDAGKEVRSFLILGTGHEAVLHEDVETRYLGTAICSDGLVWHVFEIEHWRDLTDD